MSRIKRKKIERRYKRFFAICIFAQLILLICGLLFVDFQVRATLGMDETSLISYRRTGENKYIVNIMGGSHLVDISTMRGKLFYKFAQLREMTYSIRKWVKKNLGKVSDIPTFFNSKIVKSNYLKWL